MSNVRKKDPFSAALKVQETQRRPIYCLEWSTDLCRENLSLRESSSSSATATAENDEALGASYRVLASCGGRYVNVYQVQVQTNRNEPLELIQSYVDSEEKEQYYTCVFAGRSVVKKSKSNAKSAASARDDDSGRPIKLRRGTNDDEDEGPRSNIWPLSGETGTGNQYLCVAGQRGTIKVIDLIQKRLIATLIGHGYEIYDLKRCPVDEFIILSASKDNTARLWNLKTGAQIAVLSGHEGHKDDVVSVSWHPSGDRIASGSMDSTVKLWYVGSGTPVHKAIRKSHKAAQCLAEQHYQRIDKTAEQQIPIFTTQKLHFYCVDCVHFLGDLVLSRSLEDTIILWLPEYPNDFSTMGGSQLKLPYPVSNNLTALRTFQVTGTQYWFIRFAVDRAGKTLAIGNSQGEIHVWTIGARYPTPFKILQVAPRTRDIYVRYLSFSPDDDILVAATDAGEVWKWNVYRESSNTTSETS